MTDDPNRINAKRKLLPNQENEKKSSKLCSGSKSTSTPSSNVRRKILELLSNNFKSNPMVIFQRRIKQRT